MALGGTGANIWSLKKGGGGGGEREREREREIDREIERCNVCFIFFFVIFLSQKTEGPVDSAG